MDQTMSLPHPYVEALTLSVTIFGDKSFREVIKVKSDHQYGALIPQDRHPENISENKYLSQKTNFLNTQNKSKLFGASDYQSRMNFIGRICRGMSAKTAERRPLE